MEYRDKPVLAMYDVRGIQKYIFRTAKVKDAIGASAIVENIIEEALQYAVNEMKKSRNVSAKIKWHSDVEVYEYEDNTAEVQVLYIGGGNAFVAYRTEELCVEINKIMAKYTMEHTYSLQLAVAIVEKTGVYDEDYKKLFEKMNEVKSNMVLSKPLGALPIMDIEIKTGYPLINEEDSTEAALKKQKSSKIRKKMEQSEKILDSYTTKKGTDSTISIVHIDGNNMGIRIRELVEGIKDYKEAVNKMRGISYRINSCYKNVFQGMSDYFNQESGKIEAFKEKDNQNFVMKVLTAGDDITYVCNASIALATVEYFCKEITQYTLTGKKDGNSIQQYGFSVCAGIAYIGSHFPFHAGYEVAEACCDNAKKRAKLDENKDGNRIGNFVDFQICKNVQAQNLRAMRKKEYITNHGENLLIRPYFISTPYDGEGRFKELKEEVFSFQKLKKAILFFQNSENMPRSFAKDLRNTYSMGEARIDLLYSFLESRDWKLPNQEKELFLKKEEEKSIAKWYDALEMMDYYLDLDEIQKGDKHEKVQN